MQKSLEYSDVVKRVEIKDLSDFLCNVVNNNDLYGYIFRGHSKSESYKLIPSLLRDAKNKTRKEFYLKELSGLLRFYAECNRHGLKVPDVSAFNNNGLASKFDLSLIIQNYDWSWLSDSVIELAALAQHYQMKTRMLDWTNDIMVALFFACNGKDEKSIENLSIWCLDAKNLENLKYDEDSYMNDMVNNVLSYVEEKDHEEKVKLIERIRDDTLPLKFWIPKYKDNENVYAQQGVLTIWKYNLAKREIYMNSIKRKYINEIPRQDSIPKSLKGLREIISNNITKFLAQDCSRDNTPIDELLLDYFNCDEKHRNKLKALKRPLLYKIIIDLNLKNELKGLLKNLGYDKGKVFPGYRSVIEMIEDESNGLCI